MTITRKQPLSAYLEALNGELPDTCFPLGAETIIGRKDDDVTLPENSICLADTRVSRHHARIFLRKGRFYLEDTRSTNGTFLNAFRLTPGAPCILREGSTIQVGGVYLRFRPGTAEARPKPHAPGKSEIGFNEEFFDLSLTATPGSGDAQGDFSMIFRAPELPEPEISVVLDASEVMEQLRAPVADKEEDSTQALRRLRAMTQVSIRLGVARTREALFAQIMDFIFEIFPTAERAFVILRDQDGRRDKGDAKKTKFHPAAASTREPTEEDDVLTLSEAIVDEVVRQRCSILSTDAAEDPRFKHHQSTLPLGIRSMMCVPLIVEEDVIGLIQIDAHGQSHLFDQEDLHILTGIGAQVAIALKNFGLYEEIEQVFEGFVTASVHAIEARDPTTAGHSFRVAEYSQRLAEVVDRSEQKALRDIRFSAEQLRELRYAALLHDFGKVGVREHVLIKARKLYRSQMDLLQERFRYARASLERQAYRELIDQHGELSSSAFRQRVREMDARLALESQRLQRFMAIIRQANEPSVEDGEVTEDLQAVANFIFPGEEGESVELLNMPEFNALTLARGSLTPDERVEIQLHVSHTFTFLNHIPWTGSLSSVADIAHAHHEKMDGSGYPLGLVGDEIPIQARVMTVADIFDALTAGDRPYKRSLSVDKALDILSNEARLGKVDPLLVDMFIDSQAYQLFDLA